MKQVDRIADCGVHIQDLDAMILEGKLRELEAATQREHIARSLHDQDRDGPAILDAIDQEQQGPLPGRALRGWPRQ